MIDFTTQLPLHGKMIHDLEDDKRSQFEAKQLGGLYTGFSDMTHTGILVGQRYREAVDKILL
jgi:hypothetical protein